MNDTSTMTVREALEADKSAIKFRAIAFIDPMPPPFITLTPIVAVLNASRKIKSALKSKKK